MDDEPVAYSLLATFSFPLKSRSSTLYVCSFWSSPKMQFRSDVIVPCVSESVSLVFVMLTSIFYDLPKWLQKRNMRPARTERDDVKRGFDL